MKRFLAAFACLCLLAVPAQDGQAKYVALTFDDGPSGRYTRRLLDGLAEREARATFLLCGYRIRDYSGEAERICREGHEIGIHGFLHRNMEELSKGEILKEIRQTGNLLPEGTKTVFFRPPGGSCSENIKAAAREAGLSILLWSVDPRDWATADRERVVRDVVRQTRDGDVILLHDMTDSSVDAALTIVDRLQQQGFRFVTVSELADIRGITPEPGKVYCSFS